MSNQASALREGKVTFRGETYLVRELTFAEHLFISAQSDVQDKCLLMVVLGTVNPKMTQAEVEAKPAKLIEKLLIKISRLSHPDAERPRRRGVSP